MIAVRHPHEAHAGGMPFVWATAGLAWVAALAYLLIAFNVLGVGDLQSSEGPAAIVFVCAAAYFAGGLLVLLRRRGLLITGAVMNALVILFFIQAYASRPSVMFSPGGLATKAAQILLEMGLVYLIVTGREGKRNA